jgi:hypothetical protein
VLKSGGFFALYDRIEQHLPSEEGSGLDAGEKLATGLGSRSK